MLDWRIVVWYGELVEKEEAVGCCGCLVVAGEGCIVLVVLDSVVVAFWV